MSVFLFILYLPFNSFSTIIMLVVCSLCSILCIPVLIWPSIYYNVRRFRRTMDYWSGKSRLNQQVQVDKIVARPPPPYRSRVLHPAIFHRAIRQPAIRVPPNRIAQDFLGDNDLKTIPPFLPDFIQESREFDMDKALSKIQQALAPTKNIFNNYAAQSENPYIHGILQQQLTYEKVETIRNDSSDDIEGFYNQVVLQAVQPKKATLEPPSQRSLTPSSFFTGGAALL